MNDDLVIVPSNQVSIFSCNPKETVAFATELAEALVPVIDRQGMFSIIQGKKYPKVEAWLTLGAMVGILPREADVKELPDGSYEAKVDLVNKDGRVVGGASALCSIDEKRWKAAEKYARRSMAVTRATAKAYRLAFAWIICLAGYQPTPAEEMPHDEEKKPSKSTTTPSAATSPTTSPPSDKYNRTDSAHRAWFKSEMEERGIPGEHWAAISEQMVGNPLTTSALTLVIDIMNTFPSGTTKEIKTQSKTAAPQ